MKLNFFAAMSLSAFVSTQAFAAGTIDINPGLWTTQNESWIDGKSTSEMQRQVLDKLPAAQRKDYERRLAESQAKDSQQCIPSEDAKINPRSLVEHLSEDGPWKCEPIFSNEKLVTGSYESDMQCTTAKGGHSQGHISIVFSPTTYRVEMKTRGNLVSTESGAPVGPHEIETRTLSTGQWIASKCTPSQK